MAKDGDEKSRETQAVNADGAIVNATEHNLSQPHHNNVTTA